MGDNEVRKQDGAFRKLLLVIGTPLIGVLLMINNWKPYMPAPDVYISGFAPNWLYDLGAGRDPKETLEAYCSEWEAQVNRFNEKLK